MDIEHIAIKEDYEIMDLMTPQILAKIIEWSKQGRDELRRLYWTKVWKRLRKQILAYDHNECQICKTRGEHQRATMVHHIKHLERYHSLGLSTTYEAEDGRVYRQLISLCDDCHEQQHKREQRELQLITEERW